MKTYLPVVNILFFFIATTVTGSDYGGGAGVYGGTNSGGFQGYPGYIGATSFYPPAIPDNHWGVGLVPGVNMHPNTISGGAAGNMNQVEGRVQGPSFPVSEMIPWHPYPVYGTSGVNTNPINTTPTGYSFPIYESPATSSFPAPTSSAPNASPVLTYDERNPYLVGGATSGVAYPTPEVYNGYVSSGNKIGGGDTTPLPESITANSFPVPQSHKKNGLLVTEPNGGHPQPLIKPTEKDAYQTADIYGRNTTPLVKIDKKSVFPVVGPPRENTYVMSAPTGVTTVPTEGSENSGSGIQFPVENSGSGIQIPVETSKQLQKPLHQTSPLQYQQQTKDKRVTGSNYGGSTDVAGSTGAGGFQGNPGYIGATSFYPPAISDNHRGVELVPGVNMHPNTISGGAAGNMNQVERRVQGTSIPVSEIIPGHPYPVSGTSEVNTNPMNTTPIGYSFPIYESPATSSFPAPTSPAANASPELTHNERNPYPVGGATSEVAYPTPDVYNGYVSSGNKIGGGDTTAIPESITANSFPVPQSHKKNGLLVTEPNGGHPQPLIKPTEKNAYQTADIYGRNTTPLVKIDKKSVVPVVGPPRENTYVMSAPTGVTTVPTEGSENSGSGIQFPVENSGSGIQIPVETSKQLQKPLHQTSPLQYQQQTNDKSFAPKAQTSQLGYNKHGQTLSGLNESNGLKSNPNPSIPIQRNSYERDSTAFHPLSAIPPKTTTGKNGGLFGGVGSKGNGGGIRGGDVASGSRVCGALNSRAGVSESPTGVNDASETGTASKLMSKLLSAKNRLSKAISSRLQ